MVVAELLLFKYKILILKLEAVLYTDIMLWSSLILFQRKNKTKLCNTLIKASSILSLSLLLYTMTLIATN